jgi:hypothetical protein
MGAAVERKTTRSGAASPSIPKAIPWSQTKPFFPPTKFHQSTRLVAQRTFLL